MSLFEKIETEFLGNQSLKNNKNVNEFINITKNLIAYSPKFNDDGDKLVFDTLNECIINGTVNKDDLGKINNIIDMHVYENKLNILNLEKYFSLIDKHIKENLDIVQKMVDPSIYRRIVSYQNIFETSNTVNYGELFESLHQLLNESNYKYFTFVGSLMDEFITENKEILSIILPLRYMQDFNQTDKCKQVLESIKNDYLNQDEINDEFRNVVLEKLEKFTNTSTKAKQIATNIRQFLKNSFNVVSRDNFVVEDLFSFVRISNNKDKMIFGNNQNIFEMNLEDYTIKKLPINESSNFIDILELNNFIKFGKNNIDKDGFVNLYFNDSVLKMKLNENKEKKVYLNDTLINEEFIPFMNKLSKLNQIRNKTKMIQVYEKLDNLINIDFGKNIYTKDKLSNVTIFHFGNRFYADMMNPVVETNKFLVDANATQLQQEILEFIGFDLSETLNEFLQPINKELNVFKTQLNIVDQNIKEISTMLETLDQSINSNQIEFTYNEEIAALKENLTFELENLQSERSVLTSRIYETKNGATPIIIEAKPSRTLGEKYFGFLRESESTLTTKDETPTAGNTDIRAKNSLISNGIKPNMQVFIKDINKHGLITSVNTIMDLVGILTQDGQTLSYPISNVGKNIQIIHAEVVNNFSKMTTAAEKIKDEAESLTESFVPTSNSLFTGVGNVGKFNSNLGRNLRSNDPIAEDVDFKKEDGSTINSIVTKLETTMNTFSEIEQFLNSYQKINKKPIVDILQQIDSYKTALQDQIEKL